VERELSIICLVGEGIKKTPGVAARAFGAVRTANLHMISQGASLLNLSVVVDDSALPAAVAALHREFFATLDDKVFDDGKVFG
jgi:aspartokinase